MFLFLSFFLGGLLVTEGKQIIFSWPKMTSGIHVVLNSYLTAIHLYWKWNKIKLYFWKQEIFSYAYNIFDQYSFFLVWCQGDFFSKHIKNYLRQLPFSTYLDIFLSFPFLFLSNFYNVTYSVQSEVIIICTTTFVNFSFNVNCKETMK